MRSKRFAKVPSASNLRWFFSVPVAGPRAPLPTCSTEAAWNRVPGVTIRFAAKPAGPYPLTPPPTPGRHAWIILGGEIRVRGAIPNETPRAPSVAVAIPQLTPSRKWKRVCPQDTGFRYGSAHFHKAIHVNKLARTGVWLSKCTSCRRRMTLLGLHF